MTRVLFSGGGVPGVCAFAGFASGLEAAGVVVEAWAGVSAGAIVAALCAAGLDPAIAPGLAASGLVTFGPGLSPAPHVYSARRVEVQLRRLLPAEIGAVGVDLHVVTADLSARRQVVWSNRTTPRAPLPRVVLASMAVPGALPPVPLWDGLHADGGITSNVPVNDVWPAGPCVVVKADRGPAPDPTRGPGAWAEAVLETVMAEAEREDTRADVRVIRVPALGPLLETPDKARAEALYRGGFHAAISAFC